MYMPVRSDSSDKGVDISVYPYIKHLHSCTLIMMYVFRILGHLQKISTALFKPSSDHGKEQSMIESINVIDSYILHNHERVVKRGKRRWEDVWETCTCDKLDESKLKGRGG